MGYLLLEGGAEFSGRMSEPDLKAIQLAGGWDALIAILPAAAAPDHNDERAGRNGSRWFQSLGASRVDVVPVTDKSSADKPDNAARVGAAKLIYLPGGFPRHLGETLRGSRAWKAALSAYEKGAVIGGSSAGAMVLCEYYYDPYERRLLSGLNLLSNCCILPHHNNFGKSWAAPLSSLLPQATLIGIDEQTGILNDASGRWTVYGAGAVSLYRNGTKLEVHARGETFVLD